MPRVCIVTLTGSSESCKQTALDADGRLVSRKLLGAGFSNGEGRAGAVG